MLGWAPAPISIHELRSITGLRRVAKRGGINEDQRNARITHLSSPRRKPRSVQRSRSCQHNQTHWRHTFSTLIKSLGVDAKVVQELIRHASFRTTMDSYTQALDEPKRQAQERLADLIMRTGKPGHA